MRIKLLETISKKELTEIKRIYMLLLIGTIGLCSGCAKEKTENNSPVTEKESVQTEEADSSVSEDDNDIEWNDELKIDFTFDYSEDIEKDVAYIVSASTSLQKELENMEKLIKKYTPLAQAAQTQMEMNLSSKWFVVIWDTELNNLWSRFSNSADQQTKEKILEEQRNWIDMKEEVTLLNLRTAEENGSMYPALQNAFLENITKNRVYVLANELAKIQGEAFTMPEMSEKYGVFVDNQGTGSVYSSLITRQDWEGDDEAIISIYRLGETDGTFVDNGNGQLTFISEDGRTKGIIEINGWDGASFEVTEASEDSIFTVGEIFKFPFVF